MESASKRVLFILSVYVIVTTLVFLTSGNGETYELTGKESRGQKIWRDNNCIACHSLYGVGGHLGPDLTNVSSRFGDRYITQTIKYGRGKMPGYKMSKVEIESVILFLEKFDRTGTYPLQHFPENYFGKLN